MSWLSGWTYRKKITIDNADIDADLHHFPCRIALGTNAGSTGQDVSDIFDELGQKVSIAITKSDGETQLYGEIEHWDSINKKATIWVSKPDFVINSTSQTDIYLYFDSSKPENSEYIGNTGEEITLSLTGDDFTGSDGDMPNPDLWVPDILTGADLYEIHSNKLRVTGVCGNRTRLYSLFKISGDFDIQVDLDLITAPAINSWSGGLEVRIDASHYLYVDRAYNWGHKYRQVYNTGSGTHVNYISDTLVSSKLRLTRSGSTVHSYYWNGSWTEINSGVALTSEDLQVCFNTDEWDGNPNFIIDFDNFTINSGTVKFSPSWAIWDSAFAGVWHMAQDPGGGAGCILDSTFNTAHGTPSGSMTAQDLIDGPYNMKAIEFDGVDDLITITGHKFNYDQLTLEGLARDDYSGTTEKYLASNVQSGGYGLNRDDVNSEDGFRFTIHTGSYHSVVNDPLGQHDFVYLSGRYDRAEQKLFIGGIEQSSSRADTGGITDSSVDFCIGCNAPSSGNWSGVIAEVRLSLCPRSAAWIKASNAVLTDSINEFGPTEASGDTWFDNAALDFAAAGNVFAYFPVDLSLSRQARQSLEINTILVENMVRDVPLDLILTDGIVKNDHYMDLAATDGTVLTDCRLDLAVTGYIPVYRSVCALHLQSAIKEI
jgi:hypothetical protein